MKIVEIEYTPNPNAVKFILDEPLTMMGRSAEFHTAEEAASVPLASRLFEIEHVISVYYTDRWLTVTQSGDADWYDLLRVIAEPIREATVDDARTGLDEAIAAARGCRGSPVARASDAQLRVRCDDRKCDGQASREILAARTWIPAAGRGRPCDRDS